jgi:hypothetical protein
MSQQRRAATFIDGNLLGYDDAGLQSKILRSLASAPWYVSNLRLHTDLGIPFVAAEIRRSSLLYHRRLAGHHNALVAALSTPPNVARRLERRWPSDVHSVTGD